MGGLIKILVALGFIALFSIAIITYINNFSTDNDAVVDINNDAELSNLDTDLRSDLYEFKNQVNESSEILQESTIAPGDENVEGGSQFKTTSPALTSSFKSILTLVRTKIFGDASSFGIFLTALSSFIVLIIGLYIWKAWKGGSPD